MHGSWFALMVSTGLIAGLHALAPDHWVPLVNMSTARGWSRRRLAWTTVVAGFGHVASSILIGGLGALAGISLTHLEWLEGQRGQIAGTLLIGFGLAYTLWGWRSWARHRGHAHGQGHRAGLALVAVLVIGPCEPLIPMMFVAYAISLSAVVMVALVFSLTTIAMMLLQVVLAVEGVQRVSWLRRLLASPVVAGLCIVATGAVVMALGL